MSPRQFRVILIASLVTGLIGGFIDLLWPALVPEPLAQAWAAFNDESPDLFMILVFIFCLLFLVPACAACVGLYLFRPWARPLAVITTALGLLLYPILGPNLSSGWSQLFSELSSTLWGVSLALAYFSPLKEHFGAPARLA